MDCLALGSDLSSIHSPAASCHLSLFSELDRFCGLVIAPPHPPPVFFRVPTGEQHLPHASSSSGICIWHHRAAARERLTWWKCAIDPSEPCATPCALIWAVLKPCYVLSHAKGHCPLRSNVERSNAVVFTWWEIIYHADIFPHDMNLYPDIRVLASVFMLDPTLFLIPALFSLSFILFLFDLWPFLPLLHLLCQSYFLKFLKRPCSPVAAPLLHLYHPHQMLGPLWTTQTHHLGGSRAPPNRR